MKKLFCHFEAFLMLATTVGKKNFPILFLILLLPGHIKYLFVFVLISKLLPAYVNSRKIKMLLSLPFSRSEVFIFSFITGFFMICFASVIGEVLFYSKVNTEIFLKLFIFYSAYFGVLMLVTTKGADGLTFPVLLLITDLVAGNIGTPETNIYQLLSPLYQRNLFYSATLALVLLAVSFIVFVLDRREKW